jgi:hypothetical protein
MGRRDEPELIPSDAELAEAEAATRDLLARYGEPAPAQPPPGLIGRVLAAMPDIRPGQNGRPWWSFPRPIFAWGLGVLAALLILVGGLAALAGAAAGGVAFGSGPLGRLTAALVSSPQFGGVLAVPAPGALLIALGVAIAAVAWWGLRRRR